MTLEDRLFYPTPPSAPVPEFKGSALVIPSVSIGNVPQLAVDLIIATLNVPLVGYMTSPYVVPCAGTREDSSQFGQAGVACPLEVYHDKERKLTLIQQRSPLISHEFKYPFVRDLWTFTSCFGFSKVIMIASSDAARRTDEQIRGPQFQVIQVVDPDGQSDLTTKLSQLTLSNATPLTSVPTSTSLESMKQKKFPGSGHFRHFIHTAESDRYSQREVVGIIMFAAEGDNSPDAQQMASLVCKSLNTDVENWKTPKSWEGVFGERLRAGAEEGLFW